MDISLKILSIFAVLGAVMCSDFEISKEGENINNKDQMEMKISKDPRTSFKDQKLEISYCRASKKCCKTRDDKCKVQMGDSFCYCDILCDRNATNCCPDYADYCTGLKKKINDVQMFRKLYYRNDKIWTPHLYQTFAEYRLLQGFQNRLGVRKNALKKPNREIKIQSKQISHIPKYFDARLKWNGISGIVNQGSCAASWAVSTTQVTTDRFAVQCGKHLFFSSAVIMREAGTSCDANSPYFAWNYLVQNRPRLENQTLWGIVDVPADENAIRTEIFDNGPVQAIMRVHHDFFMYRDGIYYETPYTSRFYGLHAVRLLGWGETIVKNITIKYWLAANSWGKNWGENGYFRIIRGNNECGIEERVIAPIISEFQN